MPTKFVPMPAAELNRRGMAITGRTQGAWRKALAEMTGVTARTVERYEQAEEVPLVFSLALDFLEFKPIIDQIVASRRDPHPHR